MLARPELELMRLTGVSGVIQRFVWQLLPVQLVLATVAIKLQRRQWVVAEAAPLMLDSRLQGVLLGPPLFVLQVILRVSLFQGERAEVQLQLLRQGGVEEVQVAVMGLDWPVRLAPQLLRVPEEGMQLVPLRVD